MLTLLLLCELFQLYFLSKKVLDVECKIWRKTLNLLVTLLLCSRLSRTSVWLLYARTDKVFELLPCWLCKQVSLQFHSLFRESAFSSSSVLIIYFICIAVWRIQRFWKENWGIWYPGKRESLTSDRWSLSMWSALLLVLFLQVYFSSSHTC